MSDVDWCKGNTTFRLSPVRDIKFKILKVGFGLRSKTAGSELGKQSKKKI